MYRWQKTQIQIHRKVMHMSFPHCKQSLNKKPVYSMLFPCLTFQPSKFTKTSKRFHLNHHIGHLFFHLMNTKVIIFFSDETSSSPPASNIMAMRLDPSCTSVRARTSRSATGRTCEVRRCGCLVCRGRCI